MMSDADRADQMGQATREKLNQFIARVERLEAEKAELASDIRDVYAEMKTFGLDTKVMRRVIALRGMDANERAEQDALTDLYLEASESGFSVNGQQVAAGPVGEPVVLMNKDGSRETTRMVDPLDNFMHNGQFYGKYADGAWKQL